MTFILPKTLLQFANATWDPARWSDAVLLLIDHQREYYDGLLKDENFVNAVPSLSELLVAARKAGAPVIHVFHHARPGAALFDSEGDYVKVIPGLEPKDDETIVIKNLPNSFAGTGLAETLRQLGRGNLVVGGFATHMCISATVRSAIDNGFRSTVVASACASRDLPDPLSGTIVPAEQVHRSTLAALSDRFARIVATPDNITG